jgi:hypothetical protein
VHGSREYLIPILPPAPPAPPTGDISRVDVSARTASSATPTGYKVVDEEQYEAYKLTGAIPDDEDEPSGPGELLDDFADDEPDDDPDGDGDGDGDRDPADDDATGDDDAPARDDADAPARDDADNDASTAPAKDR